MPNYPQHNGVDLDPKTYTNPDTQAPLPMLVTEASTLPVGVPTIRRVTAAGNTDISVNPLQKAVYISITNEGNAAGTVAGVSLGAGQNVTMSWAGGMLSVPFDPSTSTFLVTTVHVTQPA